MKKKNKDKKNKIELKNFNVAENNDFKDGVITYNDNFAEAEVFDPSEMFSMENGANETSIIKELFNPKNPKVKSDLTHDEIMLLARLYPMSKKFYEPRGIFLLKSSLDEFVLLRMSKDRKSREEFVRAHQEAQRNKEGGILDKLMGGGTSGLR